MIYVYRLSSSTDARRLDLQWFSQNYVQSTLSWPITRDFLVYRIVILYQRLLITHKPIPCPPRGSMVTRELTVPRVQRSNPYTNGVIILHLFGSV